MVRPRREGQVVLLKEVRTVNFLVVYHVLTKYMGDEDTDITQEVRDRLEEDSEHGDSATTDSSSDSPLFTTDNRAESEGEGQ